MTPYITIALLLITLPLAFVVADEFDALPGWFEWWRWQSAERYQRINDAMGLTFAFGLLLLALGFVYETVGWVLR